MALFTVNRYMGNEDSQDGSTVDASVVEQRLSALHKQAETRKRKRSTSERSVHVENHVTPLDRQLETRKPKKTTKKGIIKKRLKDNKLDKEAGKSDDKSLLAMDSVEFQTNTEQVGNASEQKNDIEHQAVENADRVDSTLSSEIGDGHVASSRQTEFVVLGKDSRKRRVKKVAPILPDWLLHPREISSDLVNNLFAIDSIGLSDQLVKTLKQQKIMSLFPVQSSVIPFILSSSCGPLLSTQGGYQPRDVCVSAPTGSGKTLAYVLPIIQCMQQVVVRRLRALVILPTRDLASQVSHVFHTFSKGTNVKVGLVTGQQRFTKEQQMLVVQCQVDGGEKESLVDILVTTPGRLVDHVTSTPGFSLKHVRFIVIDEADRLLDESFQDWLQNVFTACGMMLDAPSSHLSFDSRLHVSSAAITDTFHMIHKPLQKLLFSATLSQDPEKLASLHLFRPILFASRHAMDTSGASSASKGIYRTSQQYSTPDTLKEHYIICKSGEKPLVLLYLLTDLGLSHVLCFTGSVESTHRLFLLLKLFGSINVAEFSSSLTQRQRQSVVSGFRQGDIQILVCSDAMARGMDIENADHVVSYDAPRYMKTYVHRVGRTARAGREGNAYVIVREEEAYHFKRMMRSNGKKLMKIKIKLEQLDGLVERYQKTLEELESAMQKEK